MKLKLTRFDIYSILTVVLIVASLFYAGMYPWLLGVDMALILSYEVVNFNIQMIIRQLKMYEMKKLESLQFSKFQLLLKKLFAI